MRLENLSAATVARRKAEAAQARAVFLAKQEAETLAAAAAAAEARAWKARPPGERLQILREDLEALEGRKALVDSQIADLDADLNRPGAYGRRRKMTKNSETAYYSLIDRRKSYEREIWRIEGEIAELEREIL